MVQKSRKFTLIPWFILLTVIGFSSCLGYKKSLYFQGEQLTMPPVNISETYKLRKRDIIQVKIFTPDPNSAELLNLSSTQVSTNTQSEAYFNDKFVNDSGYVELPLTGKIYVEGYTIAQIDSLITVKAKDYFNIYTVDVKLASFRFTALGEFNDPGLYYVPNEYFSIYDAIGMANDATEYANKEKIQLIRTLPDGTKKIFHLNLTDYSGFTQENYYIQPYDIIYFQPQKAKVDKQNVVYLTLVLAGLSTVLLIISRF
ncbi:MAG: polysaccharide biosynthesis/export family protein [Cytophagales bacterium]|nr:polysaccharide biosynthesis/export family protein [Cytophaga sp.]